MITGYKHPSYAHALSEWGRPRELPNCNGWILERPIPGFSNTDAMGCYPLFCCEDWGKLEQDLEALDSELVTLVLVTDPFGNYEAKSLERCFPDVVIPFKTHYVIDLTKPVHQIGKKRQRKHARKALTEVQVEVCDDPVNFIEPWSKLYHHLIIRHQIEGIRAFSRLSFSKQFSLPGTVILTAKLKGRIIGAQVYFKMGNVVQCHLGALSPMGYEVGATYALDYFSFEYFADKAQWLNLGGGAGLLNNQLDGLSQYKQRWATDTRLTYFCGRIFNREVYDEIVRVKRVPKTNYFPAYRKGEFG